MSYTDTLSKAYDSYYETQAAIRETERFAQECNLTIQMISVMNEINIRNMFAQMAGGLNPEMFRPEK